MSITSVTGGSNPYSSSTSSTSSAQLLQQLEQDVQSGNTQAAEQLLKSLPRSEAHQLMQQLQQQDPSAAKAFMRLSINSIKASKLSLRKASSLNENPRLFAGYRSAHGLVAYARMLQNTAIDEDKGWSLISGIGRGTKSPRGMLNASKSRNNSSSRCSDVDFMELSSDSDSVLLGALGEGGRDAVKSREQWYSDSIVGVDGRSARVASSLRIRMSMMLRSTARPHLISIAVL